MCLISGISHDEIVKISMKYHDQEQNFRMEKEKRVKTNLFSSEMTFFFFFFFSRQVLFDFFHFTF